MDELNSLHNNGRRLKPLAGPGLALLVLICLWLQPAVLGVGAGATISLFVFFTARWDLASYYGRYLLLAATLLAIYRSAGPLASLAMLGGAFAIDFRLRRSAGSPSIHLSFPLRGGVFCAVNGGPTRLLNVHVVSESQRFAVDLVALNWWGGRARGIEPGTLEQYQVYGKVVHSPCSGVVTAIVDERPDEPPGRMSRSQPAGNHIVIRSDEADIFIGLAHLKRGTINVRSGERVASGQPLAQVGNSGNTSEPHLHIHAKRGGDPSSMLDGEGVVMIFGQRALIRNSLTFKH